MPRLRTAPVPSSTRPPAKGTVGARMRAAVAALFVLDLVLLAWATLEGSTQVRDGAGSVTTGYNVALALVVTLAAAAGVQFLRIPASLRAEGQVVMLAAQALHTLGHLARWYYVVPWYDDLLHFAFVGATAVLLLRLAEAWRILPAVHATPLRAALVSFVLALAVAGAWELFEYAMDELQGTREQDDLADTMMDMVDGLLGGIAAAAYAWRFPRPAGARPTRRRANLQESSP